jgi:hypothetical protein
MDECVRALVDEADGKLVVGVQRKPMRPVHACRNSASPKDGSRNGPSCQDRTP